MSTLSLTEEQSAAVGHPQRPLRIIAGAGTGKTTVIVARIAHLVERGQARADQILGLTFTNKAAAALKTRMDARLGADADVMIATYHSFGAGLVAEHLLDLDLHPRTRLLNRAQAWQLLFGVFDEFRFDKKRVFRPGTVVNDALVLASRCADHLVELADVEADARLMVLDARWKPSREAAQGRLELCQVVAAYDRRKRERRLIDFDDQIRLAVALLRGRPDLARQLASQRPIVLLDEYQDTNYAQRVLLQLIYGPGSAITAVGDDMQSIYAFRGAHLRNILHFGQHFPPPGELVLTENRRSGPAIVTVANRIQSQVSESVPKELVAHPGGPPAAVECFLASDDAEEAAVVAADIVALGPPWSERAVLCRKRRLIPAVATALEAAAVPLEVVGASGLLQRPEVVDLVAWLEVLADPSSSVALLRILTGPRYRLGRRDLAALGRHVRRLRSGAGAEPISLADGLADLDAVTELSEHARARLSHVLREWKALARAATHLPVLDLAETIAHRGGLWAAVENRGHCNLLRFLDLAEDFAPVEGLPGLAAFVDYVHLLDESEEDLAEAHTGDRDAVSVLTIHQAKGLEWDQVWVPGLAGSGRSKIFPDERGGANPLSQQTALPWWLCQDDPGYGDWRYSGSKEAIDRAVRTKAREEEWRLLYVACTRARHRLVCSAAHWYPGPTSPQGPSEFYRFIAAQSDVVAERFRHEPPEVDPQVTQMRARRTAAGKPAPVAAPSAVNQETLFEKAEPVRSGPPTVSVSGLVSYRRCPRQFYWLAVRPLPRRGSAAARLGATVHRWIEQRSGGQMALLEPGSDPEEADPGSSSGAGVGALAGLRAAFLASPYAALQPWRVEVPFVLGFPGRLVRGRVDAIYHRGDRLDVVDFKTGAPPEAGDRGATAQLDVYALAAVEVWQEDPSRLRTTYCYLGRDGSYRLEEREWSSERVARARTELADALGGIAAGEWGTAPGHWCRRCEWREVCPDGKQFLADQGDSFCGPRSAAEDGG